MWIFEYRNYKTFLVDYMASLPKRGYGKSLALANHLNVQQSVVTQILRHDRHMTAEQGIATASFFGFSESTTEYFVLLIQQQSAETKALKEFLEKRLSKIRKRQEKMQTAKREEERVLTDAEKGIYYSNWYYSAARLMLFIPKNQNIEALSQALDLPRDKTAAIVDFFVRAGIVKIEDDRFIPTSLGTSVNDTSEFLNNHRRNWRDKAREKFIKSAATDTFYSAPIVLSVKDAEWVRQEIRKFINSLIEKLPDSENETTRCLNIDWFEF